MKTLKFIFVVLAFIGATTTFSWGQSNFYGSIIFKNYTVGGRSLTPLFDSVVFSYSSNGMYIEQTFSKDPSFFHPETTIFTDSTCYTQYKSEYATIRTSKIENNIVKVATPTNKFQTILNHRCQKYIVKKHICDSLTITEYWWISIDLKLAGNYLRKLNENHGCPLKYEQIIERRDGKKGYTEVLEAVEIKPSDAPFDFKAFIKGKNVTSKKHFE